MQYEGIGGDNRQCSKSKHWGAGRGASVMLLSWEGTGGGEGMVLVRLLGVRELDRWPPIPLNS